MKSRSRKRPRVPRNPVAATALRVDPTRTLTLRRGVCTEVSKRLAKVRLQIHDLLVREQALRFRWATLPTEGKVNAVTNWVTTLLREALLPPAKLGGSPAKLGGSPGNWWADKLLGAYMRGASRSHDDVRRRNPQLAALGAGGKGEFLRGLVRRRALPRPVTNAYNPDQPRGKHTGRWIKAGMERADLVTRWAEDINFASLMRELAASGGSGKTLESWGMDKQTVREAEADHASLVASLATLPDYLGTAYRAAREHSLVRAAVGDRVTLPALTSLSKKRSSVDTYLNRGGGPVLVKVKGLSGKDLSSHLNSMPDRFHKWDEVVTLQPADYRVTSVTQERNTTLVTIAPVGTLNSYNPDQPRDHKGKWSAEGKVGGFGTGRNTSDHWFEDSRGAINVTVENHTAATKAMNDMAFKINDGDYLGLKDFNAAWGTYNLLYDAYWTGRSNSLYASRELRLVLQNPTNNHLNYVRTLHGNASAGFSNAARYALLYHQSDEIKSLRKLLLENAALHHDAAEALVTNAYDPQQPRGEHTGRWVKLSDTVVGQPRTTPMRGKDTPEQEARDASAGASYASHYLRKNGGVSLLERELDSAANRTDLAEEDRRLLVTAIQGAIRRTYGAHNLSSEIEDNLKSPAEQVNDTWRLHHWAAQAHQHAAGLLYSIAPHSNNSALLRLWAGHHKEAAALHHDAAEMWHGGPVENAYDPQQPRDEAGRWERLSDSAHRPYGSHPQERANQKERPSPLEEATEASEAAHEVTTRVFQLTEDFLQRLNDNRDTPLYTTASRSYAARHNLWAHGSSGAAVHWRKLAGNDPLAPNERADRHLTTAAIQHGHAAESHRLIAKYLGELVPLLSERERTIRGLVKRHFEAAVLHQDAAAMLDPRPPVANATPYVSPDDVETYGGRLQALAHRLRNELDGVTWAAAQRIARVLHDGLDQGWGAERLAQAVTDVVDSIARSRALLIANTELIRAHADGQLDALEELGEEEVTAAVEWATAGDDKVCKLCKPLDGVVLTVAEARGLIPRHVNCRCAWLPAGTRKGQEGRVMQSTLQDVTRAVKRSLRKSPANDGWFEGKAVARKRPKV